MPNITWLEPQALIDLLALNLFAAVNGAWLPGPCELAVVSPWLSDVELELRPGPWHQQLSVGTVDPGVTLSACLRAFVNKGWTVDVAVLAYDTPSRSGMRKSREEYSTEVRFLQGLLGGGVRVYLVPDLHAKGVVTPLGVITGSTNLTKSGLYAQVQNANYFAYDHADYAGNRTQLLHAFRSVSAPVDRL